MYDASRTFKLAAKSIFAQPACKVMVGDTSVEGLTDVTIDSDSGASGAFTVGAFVSRSLSFTCTTSDLPAVTTSDQIVPQMGYYTAPYLESLEDGEGYISETQIADGSTTTFFMLTGIDRSGRTTVFVDGAEAVRGTDYHYASSSHPDRLDFYNPPAAGAEIVFKYLPTLPTEPELVPMGAFYTAPRLISHKGLLSVVQAYDRAWTLTDTYTTTRSFPVAASAVMNELASTYGFSIRKNAVYARTYDTQVYVKPEGDVRSVIAGIALLIGCNAQFGRDGKLEFIPVYSDADPVEEYNGSNYRTDTYTLTSDAPVTYGELTCAYTRTITSGGEEQEVTDSWTYTAASGSRGIGIETPNVRSQARTDTLGAYILGQSGVSYYGYSVGLSGQPHLDIGDKIAFTDPAGEEYEFLVLAKTDNYAGSMTSTISATIPEDEASSIDGKNLGGSLSYAVSNAQASADGAALAARNAQTSADQAATAASAAQTSADQARTNASIAQSAANNANAYASRALGSLSTVQSVAETLTWITAHGTMQQASGTLDPNAVYFVTDPHGDYEVGGTRYSIVEWPKQAQISNYYTLSIDESLQNYVGTHLAVTGEGLWVLPGGTGYKILIAHGNGQTYTTAGTYIIDANSDTVAMFGETAQVGKSNGGHTLVSPGGMKVYGGDDGDVQLATIGYGPKDDGGQTVNSPYFAFGKGLTVSKTYGFAIGRYNHDGNYIFSVGRGSENYPRNAFAITSLGDIEINGKALTVDQDLTLSSEFTWYSQDPSAPPAAFVRRFGNCVTVQGIVCPKSTITGGVTQHTICTIPDGIGCRPYDKEIVGIMQGSGEMRWCLRIKTDGNVTFSRAERGGSYVNVDDTTWLPFCVTFNSNYI